MKRVTGFTLIELVAVILIMATLSVVSGCGGNAISKTPTTLPEAGKVSISLSKGSVSEPKAIAAFDAIGSVTITVTGPEISTPIVSNLTLDSASGSWKATFSVPVGIDRLFSVEAKDSTGKVIMTGSGKSDVKPGVTTNVTLNLYAGVTDGRIQLKLVFDSPYLGIGKISTCVGHFTMAGQNPDLGSVVPEAQVAEQYGIIGRYCNAIRTYSSTHGNEFAVKYALANGLKVYLGVWIGRDTAANDAEINAAIALAKAHKVTSIVVGSEVFLRGDATEDALVAYINKVRAAVPADITITYADTVDMWYNGGSGRPKLEAVCDYVMAYNYPFWDGVSIENAMTHFEDKYKLTRTLTTKEIVIGETGWPSAGSQNGGAVPSEYNQRRYLTDLQAWSNKNGVKIFFFEFFDEPWKTGEPGGVGVHWGLFNSDYTIKPEIEKVWF